MFELLYPQIFDPVEGTLYPDRQPRIELDYQKPSLPSLESA